MLDHKSPERNGALEAICSSILEIRAWERSKFPRYSHQISADILIYLIKNVAGGSKPSTKQFHIDLNYSIDRVRDHLELLAQEGWLLAELHPTDQRVKLYMPTKKAESLVEEYSRVISRLGRNQQT